VQPRRRAKNDAAVEQGAPRPAPGVSYFALDAAEGLQFFRCAAFSASLSTKVRASRWALAVQATAVPAAELCKTGAAARSIL
jgi:hypothetical protein